MPDSQKIDKQLLADYVATANKYNGDFEVTNSKFPELENIDKQLLADYVATANKYNLDFETTNSKFPEFNFESTKNTTTPTETTQPQEEVKTPEISTPVDEATEPLKEESKRRTNMPYEEDKEDKPSFWQNLKNSFKAGVYKADASLRNALMGTAKEAFLVTAPQKDIDIYNNLDKLFDDDVDVQAEKDKFISDRYRKVSETIGNILDYGSKTSRIQKEYADKVQQQVTQYENSIAEDFNNGDIGQATKRALTEGAASIPAMVQFLTGPTAAVGAQGMFSDNIEELEESGEKLEAKTILNAQVKTAAEYFTEKFSANLSKKFFSEAVSKGFSTKQIADNFLALMQDANMEGLSEAATSAIQDLSDVYIQGKEGDLEESLVKAIDSYIVGFGMAGSFGGGSKALNLVNSTKDLIQDNITNKVVENVVKDEANPYTSISDVYSDTNIDLPTLKIAASPKAEYFLNDEIEISVANGDLSRAKADEILQNFSKTRKALNKTKIKGISDPNRVKAAQLVAEKQALQDNIKGLDDGLTKGFKDRIAEIDNDLNNIAANPKAIPVETPIKDENNIPGDDTKTGVNEEVNATEQVPVTETTIPKPIDEVIETPEQKPITDEGKTTGDITTNGEVRPSAVSGNETGTQVEQEGVQARVDTKASEGTVEVNETVKPLITEIKRGNNTYIVTKENGTITVKNKNGETPSKPTKREVLKEYSDIIDLTEGERYKVPEGATEIDSKNIDTEIAKNSNNPSELAELALRTQTKQFIEENTDPTTQTILEYISGRVNRKSFINYSDKNNIVNSIGRSYLKKDGKPIDVLAQELSEDLGIEITEQDIVNTILEYPNGLDQLKKEVRDQYSNPAKQRFTELTGLPSSDIYLEKAVKQAVKKEQLNETLSKNHLDFLTDQELLSLSQEQIDYEKATIQGRESQSETTDTTKSETRSNVREEINQSDGSTSESDTSIPNRSSQEERGSRSQSDRQVAEEPVSFERNFKETARKRQAGKELTLHEQQDLEAKLAIELADKENLWIDNPNTLGEPFSSGHENNNYINNDGYVYKVNNLMNSNTISKLFDSIDIHNTLFQKSALYEFVGFTGDKNRLTSVQPIFRQKLVDKTELATEQEIKNYMESIGFKQTTPESYVNDDYLVFDLFPRNVLKDENGIIYVVDAEFKRIEKAEQSKKESKLIDTSSIESLSKALNDFDKKLSQYGKENLSFGLPVAVLQGSVKAMKLAVTTAKTTADIINAGYDYIINSDWFKAQDQIDQDTLKLTLKETIGTNLGLTIDKVISKEKNKSNQRAKRLKETSSKLRQKHKDLATYKKEIIKSIYDKLKLKTLNNLENSFGKGVATKINNAKTEKAVHKAVLELDAKIADQELKQTNKNLLAILKMPKKFLKSVGGKAKANMVDNETRKLFNSILTHLSTDIDKLNQEKNAIESNLNEGDFDEKLNQLVALQSAIQINEAFELENIAKEEFREDKNYESYIDKIEEANRLKEYAYNNFEALLNEGKFNLKQEIKKEAVRLKEIQEEVIEDTTHNKTDIATDTDKKLKDFENKNKWFNKHIGEKAKNIKSFFTDAVTNSFEYLLGSVDRKNDHGDGRFYKRFYSGKEGIVQLDANYKKDRTSIREELKSKFQEILGIKNKTLLSTHLSDKKINKETADTGIYLLKDGVRETNAQPFSINKALYVHLVSKMPQAKEKLALQGYDSVAMEQLEKFLGKKYVALSDFMTDYLKSKYEKYNKTYLELLRTDLGFEEGYFPLKYIDADLSMDIDLGGTNVTLPSVSSGHMKSKVKNNNRIDTDVRALDVFSEYLDSMERFYHYGRFTKDLNSVLSNKKIKNNIKTFNENAWKDLVKLSKVVIGDNSDVKAHDVEQKIYRLNSAIAAGYIGYKGYTALKQFLSIPAYTEKADDLFVAIKGNKIRIPLGGKINFGAKMAVNFLPHNVWKSYKFLSKNSTHFSERIKKGDLGDEFINNLLTRNNDNSLYKKAFTYIAKKGISPNKFIDAITISTGGMVYYNQQYNKYVKNGVDPEIAKKRAIRDFEISFKLTQQSSDASDLSVIQHSKGVLTSLFVPFKNSQFGYFRRISANSNNILRRYQLEKEALIKKGVSEKNAGVKAFAKISKDGKTFRDLENILLYTHVLPMIWQYVASGLPGLLSDWNDEDEEEMTRAALLGVVDGVFILGDALKYAYDTQVRDKNWTYQTSIIFGEMQTILNDLKEASTNSGYFSPDILGEIAKGYLKTKSINTDTFENIYGGVEKMIDDGEFSQEALMQILNAPKELKKENKKPNQRY